MDFKKTVGLFYLVYFFYTIFSLIISNYELSTAFMGIFLMFISYFAFYLGNISKKERRYTQKKSNLHFPFEKIEQWSTCKYLLFAMLCWFFSIASAIFYTGKKPIQVLSSFLGGGNTYNLYQKYFQEANIASFSIDKVPYIIMLSLLTIILFFSFICLTQNQKISTPIQKIFLLSITFSYLYFGAARGTNFEAFTIFIIFGYCLLMKQQNKKQRYASIFLVLILGVVLIYIYMEVVSGRGVTFSNNLCAEITLNEKSTFTSLFPNITSVAAALFSYLGFGQYCMGICLNKISFNSIKGVIALLLPLGYPVLYSNSYTNMLESKIDLGVRWIPDSIQIINYTGIIVYLIILYFLGKFVKNLRYSGLSLTIQNVIKIIVFLEIISLPMGNFIMTSTPNKILVLFVSTLSIWSTLRVKIKV